VNRPHQRLTHWCRRRLKTEYRAPVVADEPSDKVTSRVLDDQQQRALGTDSVGAALLVVLRVGQFPLADGPSMCCFRL